MEERLEPAHTGALDPAGGVAWARACVCVCACTCVCVCVCRGDGQGRHKGPVWYNGKIWDHVDLDSSSLMTLASYCFQVSVFSSKRRVRRSTPARPWWGCSGRCPSPCPRPLHLAGEAARPTCKSEPKLLGTFRETPIPFPPATSSVRTDSAEAGMWSPPSIVEGTLDIPSRISPFGSGHTFPTTLLKPNIIPWGGTPHWPKRPLRCWDEGGAHHGIWAFSPRVAAGRAGAADRGRQPG